VRSWRPVWKRVVWAGGGLFGLLALSAWLQVQAVRLSYRSHALRQEIAALDRREIAARRRLDTALALHRLDDRGRAQGRLGVPRPEQVRLLSEV
jgi:hypothetical protein